METLQTAKEQGSTIIVITDKRDSPVTPFGDEVLIVPVSTNLSIDSYTAVHALLTSIMRFHLCERARTSQTQFSTY